MDATLQTPHITVEQLEVAMVSSYSMWNDALHET